MPRTNWKTMAQFKICLPSEQVVTAFHSIGRTLLERINSNIHETSALAKTRNFLLPKLISGNLRVSQVERLAAEVT